MPHATLSSSKTKTEGVLGDSEKENLAFDSENFLCFTGKAQAQEAPASQTPKLSDFLSTRDADFLVGTLVGRIQPSQSDARPSLFSGKGL